MTDRSVVLTVVWMLGATVVTAAVGYVVLVKIGTPVAAAVPLSNLASAALGGLGTLLASTHSAPIAHEPPDTPPVPSPVLGAPPAPVVAPTIPSPGETMLNDLLHQGDEAP